MYNSIDMKIIRTIKSFAVALLFSAIKIQVLFAGDYTILAFGDSLTAGYGLPPAGGFTVQLEQELKRQGHNITVINGGVSGDTTSGGRARLEWVLSSAKPDMVILELGANDALRGIPPHITRANMDKMLFILKKAGIKTLVAGMMAPPNMGNDYTVEFNRIYPELAKTYDATLYPFFLEGVAGIAELNQNDAIHPNRKGVAIIIGKIIPYIQKNLK
jgi:acyl-CoA thioesterase-1